MQVFTRDGTGVWSHRQELRNPAAAIFDEFGSSVAVSGDTIVAGAPHDSGGAANTGSVHVFTRDATGVWSHVQELRDPNAARFDYLGRSVAISGDTIVAGVPGDDGAAAHAGAVDVFVRDAGGVWVLAQELRDPNAARRDHLGESVAISGDTLVSGSGAGAVHVFTP